MGVFVKLCFIALGCINFDNKKFKMGYTYLLKFFIPLLVVLVSSVTSDPLHAECDVTWTLSIDCEEAQQMVVAQMNEWENNPCPDPVDGKPNGQKCKYKHTGDVDLVTTGTHTTPIHEYVDDLTFTFEVSQSRADVKCVVKANSISETLSLLDYGTNYCNLYNLMDGSGLVNDPAWSEDTNDRKCTQYSDAQCDIY